MKNTLTDKNLSLGTPKPKKSIQFSENLENYAPSTSKYLQMKEIK